MTNPKSVLQRKEGVEYVPRRDVPYGQPYNVWHKGRIFKFCYTEKEANQVYAAVLLHIEALLRYHDSQLEGKIG